MSPPTRPGEADFLARPVASSSPACGLFASGVHKLGVYLQVFLKSTFQNFENDIMLSCITLYYIDFLRQNGMKQSCHVSEKRGTFGAMISIIESNISSLTKWVRTMTEGGGDTSVLCRGCCLLSRHRRDRPSERGRFVRDEVAPHGAETCPKGQKCNFDSSGLLQGTPPLLPPPCEWWLLSVLDGSWGERPVSGCDPPSVSSCPPLPLPE